MRLAMSVVAIVGSLLLIPSLQAADDACSLLTQAQVSGVRGVPVGAGTHQNETPNGRRLCNWSQPSEGSAGGKRVLMVLFGPIGGLTPAERFANAKKPVTGITKTPVNGIGDDAFLMVSGIGTSLYVKKGDSVIQIKVSSFPEVDVEKIEKALARDAVSKF
jgi:hypothetical protein